MIESIREKVLSAEHHARQLRETIESSDDLGFESAYHNNPLKDRKPLWNCLEPWNLTIYVLPLLLNNVMYYQDKTSVTPNDSIPDRQRLNLLELTGKPEEMVHFARTELLEGLFFSMGRNLATRISELIAAHFSGPLDTDKGRWFRRPSQVAASSSSELTVSNVQIAHYLFSNVYPKPAIITFTSNVCVGFLESIYKVFVGPLVCIPPFPPLRSSFLPLTPTSRPFLHTPITFIPKMHNTTVKSVSILRSGLCRMPLLQTKSSQVRGALTWHGWKALQMRTM